jgi:hypothetical protein
MPVKKTFDLWLGCQRALTLLLHPLPCSRLLFATFTTSLRGQKSNYTSPSRMCLQCFDATSVSVSWKVCPIHGRWYCIKELLGILLMMGKACPCRHFPLSRASTLRLPPSGTCIPLYVPLYTFTFLSNEWGLLDRHLGKCYIWTYRIWFSVKDEYL